MTIAQRFIAGIAMSQAWRKSREGRLKIDARFSRPLGHCEVFQCVRPSDSSLGYTQLSLSGHVRAFSNSF